MADTQWFVYMVRTAQGVLYTGITTNPKRRLSEHQSSKTKGAKALRGKGPLTMVWAQPATDRSAASKLESQLKKYSKVQKEQWLVKRLAAQSDAG